MKDLFSTRSDDYARFRPTYPEKLFEYLFSIVQRKDMAWDCGTGNGQVAKELARHFSQVYATDISAMQLENAVQKENIFYAMEAAEKTSFSHHSFDLITIAQAIHWFDFEAFYKEAKRTLKPGGVIAVIGYGEAVIDAPTDDLMREFHDVLLGPYWDKERKFIDEAYKTIPFPFREINAPEFSNTFSWNRQQFLGYISTWSAVKHYSSANEVNPLERLSRVLALIWPEDLNKQIMFPTLLRIGY
jgi:ubiquinone/menaquinone biosynthesis C-methylase UbiE